jgi:hypothetical protein
MDAAWHGSYDSETGELTDRELPLWSGGGTAVDTQVALRAPEEMQRKYVSSL